MRFVCFLFTYQDVNNIVFLLILQATIVDGKVRVRVNKAKAVKKRVKPMVCRSIINRSAYVIIGGGPAGFECAETLRQEGFTGRVVLVSAEDVAPYDRTKLSKVSMLLWWWLYLRLTFALFTTSDTHGED